MRARFSRHPATSALRGAVIALATVMPPAVACPDTLGTAADRTIETADAELRHEEAPRSMGAIRICCRMRGATAPLAGVALALEWVDPEERSRDGADTPCGATSASFDRANRPGAFAVTDAEGEAGFPGLAPGRYRILVSDVRFLEPDPVVVDLAAGATVRVPCLELAPAAAIAGTIVAEPDGERTGGATEAEAAPELGIALSLYGWDGPDEPIARTRADPRTGEFRFPRLDRSARFALAVPGPGCIEGAGRELRPGASRIVLRKPRGATLRVAASEEATGAPIAQFEVTVAPTDLPLDRPLRPAEMGCLITGSDAARDGEMTLTGLPRGELRLAIRAPGYSPQAARVTVPRERDQPLLLRLTREDCREIEVRDAVTGEPLERAEIVSEPEQFESAGARRLAPPVLTGRDGRGRFCPAYAGDRDFYVRAPDRAPQRLTIAPAKDPSPIVVNLTRGGALAGRARIAGGLPAAGRRIVGHVLGCRFETTTETDGRYLLAALPAGLLTVVLENAAGGAGTSRDIRIEDGRTVRLDFGAELETIVAVDDRGLPVPETEGAWRGSADDGSEIRRVRTDAEGRLGIPRSRRGSSILALHAESAWVYLRVREDADAAEEREEIGLSFPARRFEGRLLDESRTPIVGAFVIAAAGGGAIESGAADGGVGPPVWIGSNGSAATTDPAGRFMSYVPAEARGFYAILPQGEARFAAIPEGSRGDVVLADSALVRVEARGNGGPVSAALVRDGERSFSISSGAPEGSELALKAPEGLYALVVWEPGLAPYIESRLALARGDAIVRRLALDEGGRLRIGLEDLPVDDPFARTGFLMLDGFDLTSLIRRLIPLESITSAASPDAKGAPFEGVLSQVPAGRIIVACPSGPREVRLAAGASAVVRCGQPPP